MLYSRLFRRLRRPEPAIRATPRRSFVPRFEVLEDRTVPSFAGPTELLGVPGGTLVKVADVDNDSRPDIVTANGSNLNVAVYWSPGVYTQTFHVSLAAPI